MGQVGVPGVEDRHHRAQAGDCLVFQGDHAVVGAKMSPQIPRCRLQEESEMGGLGFGRHVKRLGADDRYRVTVFFHGRFPEVLSRHAGSAMAGPPCLPRDRRYSSSRPSTQRDQPVLQRHAPVNGRPFAGHVVGEAGSPERPLDEE